MRDFKTRVEDQCILDIQSSIVLCINSPWRINSVSYTCSKVAAEVINEKNIKTLNTNFVFLTDQPFRRGKCCLVFTKNARNIICNNLVIKLQSTKQHFSRKMVNIGRLTKYGENAGAIIGVTILATSSAHCLAPLSYPIVKHTYFTVLWMTPINVKF